MIKQKWDIVSEFAERGKSCKKNKEVPLQ